MVDMSPATSPPPPSVAAAAPRPSASPQSDGGNEEEDGSPSPTAAEIAALVDGCAVGVSPDAAAAPTASAAADAAASKAARSPPSSQNASPNRQGVLPAVAESSDRRGVASVATSDQVGGRTAPIGSGETVEVG